MLSSWPEKNIAGLEKLASAFAQDDNYAVFDADGTLWSNDLSESLLALLESKKVISVDRYPETMFPMPIMSKESLVSYYLRLCDVDLSLGYFWLCQSFAGFSPGELKVHVNDLFSKNDSISYMALQNDGSIVKKLIDRPSVFFWQQELLAFLFQKKINVYVVTASLEELVRIVVADPKYGFDIPPSNVIGMRLALRASNGNNVLGQYDKNLNKEYYESMITPSLSGITTWYSGKVAAIKEYIDPAKKPVLAAGNSESDLAMLNYVNTDSGIKILVTKNLEQQRLLKKKICITKGLADKDETQFLKTKNWEFVFPDQF